jgi:hypothetical protein
MEHNMNIVPMDFKGRSTDFSQMEAQRTEIAGIVYPKLHRFGPSRLAFYINSDISRFVFLAIR